MRFLGRLAKFWLFVSFVGSAGYFGYFNRERISVTLPPWADTIAIPAFAMYVAIFLIGAFSASVYLGMDTVRRSMEIRRLNRRLRELDPHHGSSSTDLTVSSSSSTTPSPSNEPRVP